MNKIFFLITIQLTLCIFGYAQTPVINQSLSADAGDIKSPPPVKKVLKGIVRDSEGNEIIGAYVTIILANGRKKEGATDYNGEYKFYNIPTGICEIIVENMSFKKTQIKFNIGTENVVNKDIVLKETGSVLESVVITARAERDNEATLLAIKKRAVTVQDGISTEELSKLGVSNAAESVKQITGASVEDGKYIVIRGLGDRYSLTLLDGIVLPSSNPYKNAASMDIIPAGIINNVITMKTFTPELPGNFAGGLVNVESKSIPNKFYLNVGVNVKYNTNANLKDNFLTDATSSSTDVLGYDDGTRTEPAEVTSTDIDKINRYNAERSGEQYDEERTLLDKTSKSLSTPFVPASGSSFLNQGCSVTFGDALSFSNDKKLGYNLGIDYSYSYDRLANGKFGLFEDTYGDGRPLQSQQDYDFKTDSRKARIGTLSQLSFKFNKLHEVGLTNMYNHEGGSHVDNTKGFWRQSSLGNADITEVKWEEQGVFSSRLHGKHTLADVSYLSIKWSLGYTTTSLKQPDRRLYAYSLLPDDKIAMSSSELGTLPTHFYRNLNDKQLSAKLDIEIPVGKHNNNIKVGGSYSQKDRVFDESRYTMLETVKTSDNPDYIGTSDIVNQDFTSFFSSDNAGVVNKPTGNNGKYGLGNVYSSTTLLGNSYTGNENIFAVYAQGTFKLQALTLTTGLRVESTNLNAQSKDKRKKAGVIDVIDFLPALNLNYALTEKTNVRLALSQTVARPNVREIAPFEEFYFGRIINGNPNLKRTKITNIDARFEIYPKPLEVFSVSVFAKTFKDPIVNTLVVKTSNSETIPQNVDSALTYGIEFEYRKNLAFIHTSLHNFSFSTNLALVHSSTEKSQEEKESIKSVQQKNVYTYISETRPFQGQSPYILNIALSHKLEKIDWSNTMSFNVFGDRLYLTTDYLNPDVYEKSRPTLNFVSTKHFGEQWKVVAKIKNILNPDYKFAYNTSEEEVRTSYNKGIDISLSISYNF